MRDLHASGLLRMLQPRRWGGMELDFVAYIDVPYELGARLRLDQLERR